MPCFGIDCPIVVKIEERRKYEMVVTILFFSYLAGNSLFEPPVVYFVPSVSKYIGFTLWDLCNQYNFVIQTVPQNIYNYLRTANLGIFDKLERAFEQEIARQ